MPTLIATEFEDLQLYARGKVRDLYAVGDLLLLVATDRISAFDHVLATGIPGKGRVLTQISLFWFDYLSDLVPNHLVTADVEKYPAQLRPYAERVAWTGRCWSTVPACFPLSAWSGDISPAPAGRTTRAPDKICGIALPPGLRESERLPEPIFTPATKSMSGEHDENISFDQMVARVGGDHAEELRRLSLAIYAKAADHALRAGIDSGRYQV